MTKKTKNPLTSLKKSLTRNLLIGIITLVLTLVITIFFLQNAYLQTRAAPQVVINPDILTTRSQIANSGMIARFVLESKRGKNLFQTQNRDIPTVLSTLDRGVKYKNQQNNVQNNLLPESIVQNARLARTVDDTKDSYLKSRGFNLTDRHLIFTQQLKNIPVLGSSLGVHMASDNTVYQMTANLTTNENVPQAKISDDDAKQIVLNEAKKDTTNPDSLEIRSADRTIVNKKLLGISEDSTNYLTLAVNIYSKGEFITFAKRYYVDLVSSQIIYDESLVKDALNRSIYDCSTNPNNCLPVRQEGGALAHSGEVDQAYDFFGNIYNFWSSTFHRDSYDDKGASLKVLVNLSSFPNYPCPNANWFRAPLRQWQFCKNMVLDDIAAHEYTHAVVESTANLGGQNESGTLDEGIADVFSHAFSPNNWTIGEGSPIGIIRDQRDPTKSPPPNGPQPDRLFSQYFYCGVNQSVLVHVNNGILNKAFYLMVEGGNFNGCQVGGQGVDKIIPIFYRALTVYLTPTSNYGAMYDAMNRSCVDLYSESSAICATVKSAMQATEMDQQNLNSQQGPMCENIAPKVPACQQNVSISPTPTPSPITSPAPTSSTLSPTPIPLPTISGPIVYPTEGPGKTVSSPDTDWIWPQSPTGYDSFTQDVTIKTTPSNMGYVWSHFFGFNNSSNQTGFFALESIKQNNGLQKVANFSIYGAVAAEGPGFAGQFTESGNNGGYQTYIPFNWIDGRDYKMKVAYVGQSPTGGRWQATIVDTVTQTQSVVGTITVLPTVQKLASISIVATGLTPGTTIQNCGDIAYTKVLYTNPKADDTISPDSHSNSVIQSQDCTNYSVTDVTGGVMQEAGLPPELITPITGASPTPSSNTSSMTLNLALRFQGILRAPSSQFNRMNVKVTVAGGSLSSQVSQTAPFTADSQGIWRGSVTFNNIPEAGGYRILIKGPKHLQQKICENFPSEPSAGSYHCGEGNITLFPGQNDLDFSGIYQMSGDLPINGQQDGLINSVDLVTIVSLIGKTDADSLIVADVNLDGIIDSQDFSLVIATLSKKFDDE